MTASPASCEIPSKRGHALILGGARSGKSTVGEKVALAWSGNGPAPAYLATSQAVDSEMTARIQYHRQNRDSRFKVFEEPFEVGRIIASLRETHPVILVDCLTVWLSNIRFMQESRETPLMKDRRVRELFDALANTNTARIILISNEVGGGIVPDIALARRFRDEAGILHQELARICSCVTLVTAGLCTTLKGAALPG